MRKCTNCNRNLSLDNFYKISANSKYRRRTCKSCEKEARKLRLRQQKVNDPVYKSSRATYYRYGITDKEYKSLLVAQDFKCKICSSHDPGHHGRLCVDHCHATGRIRGLLCHKCNAGLGFFRDNIECLKNAIGYLRGKR